MEKIAKTCAKTEKTNLFGLFLTCSGAGGGTRTLMRSPSLDFESSASTNSTTPARVTLLVYHNKCDFASEYQKKYCINILLYNV